MEIVITGGTSFIGLAVTEELLKGREPGVDGSPPRIPQQRPLAGA